MPPRQAEAQVALSISVVVLIVRLLVKERHVGFVADYGRTKHYRTSLGTVRELSRAGKVGRVAALWKDAGTRS